MNFSLRILQFALLKSISLLPPKKNEKKGKNKFQVGDRQIFRIYLYADFNLKFTVTLSIYLIGKLREDRCTHL